MRSRARWLRRKPMQARTLRTADGTSKPIIFRLPSHPTGSRGKPRVWGHNLKKVCQGLVATYLTINLYEPPSLLVLIYFTAAVMLESVVSELAVWMGKTRRLCDFATFSTQQGKKQARHRPPHLRETVSNRNCRPK